MHIVAPIAQDHSEIVSLVPVKLEIIAVITVEKPITTIIFGNLVGANCQACNIKIKAAVETTPMSSP